MYFGNALNSFGLSYLCFAYRVTHSGGGIPEEFLSEMFENRTDTSEEGISLLISRKLLRLMNGDVRYLREAGKSSFIISVELASALKS
ncbi:hypothetical protein GIB67_018461 [Kingdonia uniflora]|uniref:Histidine kinase domain-containing protein n=1 Tax=Kingdonia uniflora TaxID=39325 RepID=A0A7J7LJP7_9MAGN|nr:hypothetical protein GIB67_018461 [Kingdonia uniflora]